MIRFGGRTADGRALIGLALGAENLRRLQAGQPIFVDGKSVGAPGVVVIVACAEKPEDVMRELVRTAGMAGVTVEELETALRQAGVEREG